MNPFVYPTKSIRRHGPIGYLDYSSYRPWLRDEFEFRCVYCLRREQWGIGVRDFAIDHFLPVSAQPDADRNYLNLFYSCATCNLRKGSRRIDDPTAPEIASALTVFETGQILGTTPAARRLIRVLDLDGPASTEFRQMWISTIRLAALYDAPLFCRLLGYPEDIPDLSVLRPPGGNRRPEGIAESAFAKRQMSELPDAY